jgi:ornithine cyclodeaminase
LILLDADEVADLLPYDQLIQALAAAFSSDVVAPDRTHHEIVVPGSDSGRMLLMPAWHPGHALGLKVATVFSSNAQRGLPTVMASYMLMDAETGLPTAILDGTELTLRRTAAASALASSFLSQKSASKLLMVGTGQLAPHMIAAHASARPIDDVCIWGRRRETAEALAESLADTGLSISIAENLEQAVAWAEIICCATSSVDPLIRGFWLRGGQHLDLVGAYQPNMAEVDSACMARCEIYVDTRSGALAEAGEIVQAIEAGIITEPDIRAEMSELATGEIGGRESDEAITLFKSVGTALEDLAAAELAMANYSRK